LENNVEKMRHAWDPQKPVEPLFKQIQDCADYSEAGGVIIGHPQQINVGYDKIFSTGYFMSACRRWNENPNTEKTWHNSKHTSPLHIGNTSKCRVNLQLPQDIMQKKMMWVNHKIKWIIPPLALFPTWLQLQQLTAEW
jgi:hypothetical protein